MKVGIVGAEAAKFTMDGEAEAKQIITRLLTPSDAILVSGHCHLGGIDIWAEEIADQLGRKKIIFPPKNLNWSTGYKPRNIQIAVTSDEVHNITVNRTPANFNGMRFSKCYHCNSNDHVKSGGCWTMKRAKKGQLYIVTNA